MDIAELYSCHYKRLYHICFSMTRDAYLAEDIVQETFIKERPISKGASEKQKVLVDDVTFVTSELQSGVIGTIEATRLATGIRRGPELMIHGSQGSLRFNAYSGPDVLDLYLNSPRKISNASGFEKLMTKYLQE